MDNLIAPYRQKWQNCFPNVILNAALGDASKHSYYVAAKSGDLDAALILAIDLVNQEAIEKLATIIQNEKPLLVPVHAEEAISINRIPL
ncbi:MAG: hypothetical protein WCL34_13295, partial [Methylococcaceae bacterium]